MFVGHAALALSIAGLGAYAAGWSRERSLALGIVAALFATIPDVDVLFAVPGVFGAASMAPLAMAEGFWAASTTVHRLATHSVLVGLVAAVGFALYPRRRLAGAAVLFGVLAMGMVPGDLTALLLLAIFVLAGLAVTNVATWLDLPPGSLFVGAAVGLLSHPFGDLFTGDAPALFYPLPIHLLDGHVSLAADPTLHLLGAFFFEVLAIWLGLFTLATLTETSLATRIRPRAVLAGGYAIAVFVLPAPTLDVSYHFVFSVLAMGVLGVGPRVRRLPDLDTVVVTGFASVTVAGLAYAVAYLLATASPVLAG